MLGEPTAAAGWRRKLRDIGMDAPPYASWAYIVGSRCSGAEPGCGMPFGPGHDAFLQSFYIDRGPSDELSMFGEHIERRPVAAVATDPSGNVIVRGGPEPGSAGQSPFNLALVVGRNHRWSCRDEQQRGAKLSTGW